ncbi:MAG: aromatic ring-hydroxylating dioxygenase subunit alpha [Acidimicrobiales bacterium]
MDRAQQLALADEVLRRHREGPAPADGAATPLATAVYTDPVRHRAEVGAMATRPMAAVAASELAMPGDFVTLRVGGVPLVIVRGNDGVVRAVHNACAHRGATVEPRPSGSTRVLSCGFHGWAYELDGSLRSVADAAQFSATPCGRGLRPVGCEERHGIVWVTLEQGPDLASVRAWLGDELDDVFSGLGFGGFVAHRSTTYELACNWKLLTDGFLELYHLKALHRSTIAPYVTGALCFGVPFGEHIGSVIPKNRLARQLTTEDRDHWRVLDDLSLPFVLVPGTVLQWQAGHLELFSFRPDPLDPRRTSCRLTLLVPAERAGERDLWERNWARVCATICDEDFPMAEDVQRNIDAGVADELLIGRNESLLLDHLAAVDRLVSGRSTSAPA